MNNIDEVVSLEPLLVLKDKLTIEQRKQVHEDLKYIFLVLHKKCEQEQRRSFVLHTCAVATTLMKKVHWCEEEEETDEEINFEEEEESAPFIHCDSEDDVPQSPPLPKYGPRDFLDNSP